MTGPVPWRAVVSRSGLAGGRRSPALALVLVSCLVLVLCAAGSPRSGTGRAFFPLYSGTVAVGAGGGLVGVFDPALLVPGTRVLAGTGDSRREADEQRAWLAAGTVPSVPELGRTTMVRDALLDLHVLATPHGVATAGWATPWRYVWPRDSALVAVALSRTGHPADAERVISFLERAQHDSGGFQARYRPDGTGVPDGRGPQTDSLGWALWALREVGDELPDPARRAFVERHRGLLDRSTVASLALVANARSLPPPSSDYWELKERRLTLSTAALLAAGLTSAARLYGFLGDHDRAATAEAAGVRTTAAIRRAFAADGYPREEGGSPQSVDLGVSYLLPPFTGSRSPDVLRTWHGSAVLMARTAGGLAPGGSWRDDGVSWNTATSSYAMTAAFLGDRDEAVARLRWLDHHRTACGSLPEKVLYDGRPASVAPLAWAAAAVIIAADELADRPR